MIELRVFLIFIVFKAARGTSCSENKFEAGPDWRELTSPFWPQPIHGQQQCEWELTAPMGRRVQLSFETLALADKTPDEYGDGTCLYQSVDLIDGPRVAEDDNNYISFCGRHTPSIDFVSEGEVMRVYLRSDVSTAASTGDEKYKLKFRFTEQEGNMEEYMTGTVRTQKAGYLMFRPIRLRNGLMANRNSIHHENINILSHQSEEDYDYDEEDPAERTVDSMGRVRSRVRIGKYDPSKVVKQYPTLEPPKVYESPPAPEPEPSGGFLASIATGSLAFIIFMAVFSVYCFQKHGKDPSQKAGTMVYCTTTKRYISVDS